MKKHTLFVFLFLLPFLTTAQNIVLSTCTEITDASLRNDCLKASLENLLIKEVFRNLDIINLQPEEFVGLSVNVNLSKNGFFSLKSISTPNFGLAKSVNNALRNIQPLYKDKKNNGISSNFQFDYLFKLDNTGAIVILHNDKEVLLRRTLDLEEEVMATENSKDDQAVEPENNQTEKESDDVAFAVIENVPIFPGCEGLESNKEFKDCMSKKISSMVINNFNLGLAGTLGLKGRQRISVQFKIDSYGFVTDVLARAPHPALEEEAKRVINLLPKFIPGKQRGEAVGVLYSLPIIFDVEGTNQAKKSSGVLENPIYPGCDSDDNSYRSKCMRVKIDEFIKSNYDISIVDNLDLPKGIIQIDVDFKIDSKGNISEVKAKGPHQLLEKEAISTLYKLPKIKPGKKDGASVGFSYTLPIIFSIEN